MKKDRREYRGRRSEWEGGKETERRKKGEEKEWREEGRDIFMTVHSL